MMHPFSKCEIERPLDRPMSFIFSPPEIKPEENSNNKKGSPRGWSSATTPTRPPVLTANDRTNILCTFQPELGARTIQVFTTKLAGNSPGVQKGSQV